MNILQLGLPAAAALKLSGCSVGALESTSAGLISACLQSCPGASNYWSGSLNIYSAKAAKAFLPRDIQLQLGKPKDNYASASKYVQSKQVFTKVLGKFFRDKMKVDWFIAESGAAEASIGVTKLSGAFTVLTLLGPNDIVITKTIYGKPGGASRVENMWLFTQAALAMLEKEVTRYNGTKNTIKQSKL